MRSILYISFLLFSVCPCSAGIFDLKLKSEKNGKTNIGNLKEYEAVAFIFLSPECPLSRNYTLHINRIYDSLKEKKVVLYAVFSGKLYSKKQIRSFREKYHLQTDILYDPHYALAREVNASVTPEAFLIDPVTEKITYRGAIDNWVIDLGKQRKEITAHYLYEAINHQLKGEKIEISRTRAIGCFLEIK